MEESKLITRLTSDLNLLVDEVEEKLDTNSKYGLDAHEAYNRFEDNGPNVAASKDENLPSQMYILAAHVIGVHNSPLWCGAILTACAYLWENYVVKVPDSKSDNLYISIGLIAFIFVFAIFSFYFDIKCKYYIDSCQDLVLRQSTVIRDGIPQIINQENLVVGDLVIFHRGDEIAADIKITESSGVQIYADRLDEVQRHYYEQLYGKFYADKFFDLGDLIFSSSFVAHGHGKGIVMRTQNFYLTKVKLNKKNVSKVGKEIEKPPKNSSSLKTQIEEFLRTLSWISLAISSCYGVSIYFLGFSWIYSMMFFIAHYVGIITEALIPTFSVAKAQSAKELAYKNCYIQNIEALETLGTTSIICTNKTGVITQNKMIVSRIWFHNQEMASYEFIKKFKGSQHLQEPIKSLVNACSLSIFAHFTVDENNDESPFKRNAIGKPSEMALLRFMEAFIGSSIELYQTKRNCRQLEVSFNSNRKCSYKVYKKSDKFVVCIKGEPEVLIEKCRSIMTREGLQQFSSENKQKLLQLCNEMGQKKYRMLAIAQMFIETNLSNQIYYTESGQINLPRTLNILENKNFDFQFLGLIMLENPVRMSVPDAIFTCRRAGIKVIMTTGDHPETSLSIAKTVGIVLANAPYATIDMESLDETTRILHHKRKAVYTGMELSSMTDGKLKSVLTKRNDLVFARITQDDKLRIVKCARELKHVVAVTGIGSNDLLVFEAGDVSLSMGQYGSDIAKRNSDVILLDDNFSSIIHGIQEGRVLFENIKKSLCYTLSSKPVELLPYVLFLSLSIPKMAGPIIILAIDLITDNLPPIALGYEWAESYVMNEAPTYFLEERLVNFETIFISLFFYGIIQFTSGFYSYVVVMADNGFYLSELIGIRKLWTNRAISDLEDSFGQEWTYRQRVELEQCCQTVYFVTIVITRIAVLFSCRTRKDSCLRHLFSNSMVNFTVFFLLFFAVFLSYYSPFQYSVHIYPLKLYWWFLGIPFFLLICLLEEMRKFVIRKYPKSSTAKIIYY